MSRKLRARCLLHSFLSVSDATVASVDKTEMTLLFVNRYLEPFFFNFLISSDEPTFVLNHINLNDAFNLWFKKPAPPL